MISHGDSGVGTRDTTDFAPAARADRASLAVARERFRETALATLFIDAVPDAAFVLNEQRQVVAANRRALALLELDVDAQILGQRPGEVLGCVNAKNAPGGCGTSCACASCGAVLAVLETLAFNRSAGRECRIRVEDDKDGGALDFRVVTTPVTIGETRFVVMALRDIGDSKRRRVLERVFFHDVLNTVSGLQGITELLATEKDPVLVREYVDDLQRISAQIVEEILGQRLLSAAESGELRVEAAKVGVDGLIDDVVATYRRHPVCDGHVLKSDPRPAASFGTDARVLRRILSNLVKNAIEATPAGGTVTVGGTITDDGSLRLVVHNPTVMSPSVKRQIFQRSFSTKRGRGRGIGTYSIRLFAERYLGGRVSFDSAEGLGTTFVVTLPSLAGVSPF